MWMLWVGGCMGVGVGEREREWVWVWVWVGGTMLVMITTDDDMVSPLSLFLYR